MKRCTFVLILITLAIIPFSLPANDFRVGLMPAKESLPFYAEEKLQIFKKHGINLIAVPFRSALERDSAFEAGKIDGAINDIVGTTLLAKSGRNIKIVRTIAKPARKSPVFSVMATPTEKGLRETAVSYNTVIEYVTDRIMEKEKLAGTMKKVEIKSVPMRMQLLLDGKVGYATIAEPLATYMGMKGAKRVYTDVDVKGSHVVFVTRGDLDRSFLRNLINAYDDLCGETNKRKGEFKDLLWKKLALPDELRTGYHIPDLITKEVPKREEVEDVHAWMRAKGLLKNKIGYEKLVHE
ncbi:MAG TPA: hypothetical protein PLR60_06765 [Syntrophorhabdaceae bacterium]|nr:hypothetical protein [Syntrophorhabdaceae bacterium]